MAVAVVAGKPGQDVVVVQDTQAAVVAAVVAVVLATDY